ncbi:hypothetical protein Sjap_023993 [Stephania japonica]|uniref:Uncharacterized protein n=1 Tax=Stephania japonica TaxID=461633 RepID=A0AAP0ECM2_9MAGN
MGSEYHVSLGRVGPSLGLENGVVTGVGCLTSLDAADNAMRIYSPRRHDGVQARNSIASADPMNSVKHAYQLLCTALHRITTSFTTPTHTFLICKNVFFTAPPRLLHDFSMALHKELSVYVICGWRCGKKMVPRVDGVVIGVKEISVHVVFQEEAELQEAYKRNAWHLLAEVLLSEERFKKLSFKSEIVGVQSGVRVRYDALKLVQRKIQDFHSFHSTYLNINTYQFKKNEGLMSTTKFDKKDQPICGAFDEEEDEDDEGSSSPAANPHKKSPKQGSLPLLHSALSAPTVTN